MHMVVFIYMDVITMVCACDYGGKKSVIGSPGTEIADNSEPSFGCQELWSSGRAASPLNL